MLGKRAKEGEEEAAVSKRQKTVNSKEALEHHYLENMPYADMYERSYMHKDTICHSKFIEILIIVSSIDITEVRLHIYNVSGWLPKVLEEGAERCRIR